MKMIFIRHGSRRSSEGELTSFGRKMSFQTDQWLAKKGYFPQREFHSPAVRTQQTLQEVLLGSEIHVHLEQLEIAENWEDWISMLEKISKTNTSDVVIVGHHPTTEMLASHYNIHIPTQNFATAIVLQQSSDGLWDFVDSWQGQTAIS